MTAYLKFSDEAEARAVLAQYLNEDGYWICASHSHALDVVGVITKTIDEETFETLPGFHVNYIGDGDFSEYEVFPTTPNRMFAQ